MGQLHRDYSGESIAWHREAQAKGRVETLSQEAITLYHWIKLQGTPKYTLESNRRVCHIFFIFQLILPQYFN